MLLLALVACADGPEPAQPPERSESAASRDSGGTYAGSMEPAEATVTEEPAVVDLPESSGWEIWSERLAGFRTSGGRILVGFFFALIGLACVVAVPFGFPGTWVLILMALVIEAVDMLWLPEASRQTFSWLLLALCVVLALFGELIELAGSAVGAGRAGSTRWGMAGAIAGGVLGAVMGIFFPPPVLGALLAALVGAFLGALIAEVLFARVGLRESIRPALGAALGRALGGVGKALVAVPIWAVLTVSAFWP